MNLDFSAVPQVWPHLQLSAKCSYQGAAYAVTSDPSQCMGLRTGLGSVKQAMMSGQRGAGGADSSARTLLYRDSPGLE